MEHFLWETNLKEIVENKWETVQVELLRHHTMFSLTFNDPFSAK